MVNDKRKLIFCLDKIVLEDCSSLEAVRGFFLGYALANAEGYSSFVKQVEQDLGRYCALAMGFPLHRSLYENFNGYSFEVFVELYRQYRETISIHDAIITMNDGRIFYGTIWTWTPQTGSFVISDRDNFPVEVRLADVSEAYEHDRIDRSGVFRRIDLLEKARNDGWIEKASYNESQQN